MGHIRLGRLPKTLRWQGVVRLLEESPDDVVSVAGATVVAATRRLRELRSDPSLTYCFWLLTRLAAAARRSDFPAALAGLGIEAGPDDSTLSFIARVSDRARDEASRHPESGPFAELASLALRRALSETAGQEGRSLFGTSVEDLQTALRRYSGERTFGRLSRAFFADFFARTLRFFVERELSNSIGPGRAMSGIGESAEFAAALDLYARQSARIMEDFASGWYSKHDFESKGQISREEAQGFVAVAMRKLRMELARSEA